MTNIGIFSVRLQLMTQCRSDIVPRGTWKFEQSDQAHNDKPRRSSACWRRMATQTIWNLELLLSFSLKLALDRINIGAWCADIGISRYWLRYRSRFDNTRYGTSGILTTWGPGHDETIQTCLNMVHVCTMYRHICTIINVYVPVYTFIFSLEHVHTSNIYARTWYRHVCTASNTHSLFCQYSACKLLLKHCCIHHLNRVSCVQHWTPFKMNLYSLIWQTISFFQRIRTFFQNPKP